MRSNYFAKPKAWYWLVAFMPFLAGCATTAPTPSDLPIAKEATVACPPPAVDKTPTSDWPSPLPTQPKPAELCPPLKCPVCPAVKIANKPVLGEYEMVTLKPMGFRYLARIDTGATGTSVHAEQITRFERDGRKWVRFALIHPKTKAPVTLERKLVRRIRVKSADMDEDKRLVVLMSIKLGTIEKQLEVSLSDRARLEFPVLIGRNFLLDTAIVDVSLRRTIN